MEWMKGLQQAIDYIENNITNELDYTEIAEKAYSSSFHFQRNFSIFTGITVGEYIRNRRLTLAGEEVSTSSTKIVDLANKYGYDSPESFTKAFTRFHGITPSAARKEGYVLKSFNRLSINVVSVGGEIMKYQMIKKAAFQILARVRKVRIEEGNRAIPDFWSECSAEGCLPVLHSYARKPYTIGLFMADKEDEKSCNYGIGVECEEGITIPEGYQILTIPEHKWAVFIGLGPLPEANQVMWRKIYTEFFPQSGLEYDDDLDFEVFPYQSDHDFEIWIPVKSKAESK
ncbi:MAG: soxS [Herbinix sp.]|jgi:AraC family transcriptional regulator|nr:soxS [Herbinix sp.]